MKKSWLFIIGILLFASVVSVSCACLTILASLRSDFLFSPSQTSQVSNTALPTPPNTATPSSTRTPRPTRTALPTASPTTLEILSNTVIPINNLLDLAARLEGRKNLPTQLEFPAASYNVGDQTSFWVTNSDNNENFQVNATLRSMTEHAYFWIQDGITFNKNDLNALMEAFETKIYPTNREFFGSEWTPGVDADPRLYILYARGLGERVAGYFSTVDEYLPVVRADSNGHEMFFLSADHLDLSEEYTYGVLAHEFQHMIHWYRDRNEETWVNEGFSDLAMFLNGYSIGNHDFIFVDNPDIQLTDWPTEPSERSAHYGASFMFLVYFLDRFGEQATQALVAEPDNGMSSLEKVLAVLGVNDPLTGEPITADDFFMDWVVTTFLQDGNVGDGRFLYRNYPGAPQPDVTESITECPLDEQERQVSQYGADYIRITCQGDFTLHFEGDTEVRVVGADMMSGLAFYSNRGDESDMTLTRSFDFTSHSGPLTLTYWTWYNLEEDYDYVHLLASEDGERWQILTTPSGTIDDPSGNSFGWGYNGLSGGGPEWIEEKVDISQFAGKKVRLRFEYITDAAVNGDGFLVDDISIPEVGYFSDFEQDDGGWQAAGFVRIQNSLPQTFRISLIYLGKSPRVETLQLPSSNLFDIPLRIANGIEEVILAISGTTRFTTQKATYWFSLLP